MGGCLSPVPLIFRKVVFRLGNSVKKYHIFLLGFCFLGIGVCVFTLVTSKLYQDVGLFCPVTCSQCGERFTGEVCTCGEKVLETGLLGGVDSELEFKDVYSSYMAYEFEYNKCIFTFVVMGALFIVMLAVGRTPWGRDSYKGERVGTKK